MRRHLSPRYRWAVASRAVAAIVGGYVLTWLFTAAVALLLRQWATARADAVLAATMISFLVYAVAAMAVFYARSPMRAWIGLLLASVPPVFVLALLWSGRR